MMSLARPRFRKLRFQMIADNLALLSTSQRWPVAVFSESHPLAHAEQVHARFKSLDVFGAENNVTGSRTPDAGTHPEAGGQLRPSGA
jgi:hypothetical protein